jgi:hypothetical protein
LQSDGCHDHPAANLLSHRLGYVGRADGKIDADTNSHDELTEQDPLSVKSETTEHNGVRVSIADTGSGIDPANLNRVFKPMFTTKTGRMGNGSFDLQVDHREPQWSDLDDGWCAQRLNFSI